MNKRVKECLAAIAFCAAMFAVGILMAQDVQKAIRGNLTTADEVVTNVNLAAYAKQSEITNVVNEVKSKFFDEPLTVEWTVKMVNGEMKLYATTNVNTSVLK